MRCLRFPLLLAGLASLAAAEPAGFVGRLLEDVACTADPSQHYALYVPSSYTPAKAWPVLFCFDAGAHGTAAVERYQAAAERFGWVVAGSNTSRNGPWAANLAAIEAMERDVRAHLSIDSRRIYATGHSGGARVATQMALMGMARGVIACSAGFPADRDALPRSVPFFFFGTAGTTDFNHREMQRLDGDLEARRATHRTVFFDGGHEWPPAPVLTGAVEWIELQSMRTGVRPRDDAMIQSSCNERLAAARALEPGPAWAELAAIASDFRELADTREVEARVRELAASKEVKAWKKRVRALADREDELGRTIADLVADGSRGRIREVAAGLRKEAEVTVDSPERQMIRRAIAGAVSGAREFARQLGARKAYGDAESWLELSVALRPGQSRTWFELARIYALDGETRRALESLDEAVKAGCSDAERAEKDPAFAALRQEPAFQAALASMRRTAR